MFDYSYIKLVISTLALLSVTAVGLLAVWAALGRGHWFVRVAIVGILLSLLLFVPAYEPLVVFTVQLIVAVPVLMFARRLRAGVKNRATWQFGLRDLLLLTLVVAALAATAAGVPKKTWQSWDFLKSIDFIYAYGNPTISPWLYLLIFALAASAVTCLAAWITLGRCRLWKRLIVLLVVFPGMLAGLVAVFHFSSLWPHQQFQSAFTGFYGAPKIHTEEMAFLYAISSLFIIVAWLWLFRASAFRRADIKPEEIDSDLSRKKHQWLRWPARAGLLLLSLAILVPLAWTYWVILTPSPIPQATMPEPNGYARIVDIGKRHQNVNVPIPGFQPPQGQLPKPKDFFDFKQQNGDLLTSAQEAIALPALVPLSYDASDMDAITSDLQHARHLARALNAAGRAEYLRDNYEEGTQWSLDTIRLGRSFGRGGLYIHWLVDLAIEGMGMHAIHEVLPDMTTQDRMSLRASLEQIGEGLEPLEIVKPREDAWSQNAYGWLGGLSYQIMEVSGENVTFESIQNAEKRYHTLFRILLVEIALENYRERHGRYPERLEELVPGELKKIPLDPADGQPLRYRKTDKGYLLYGIGRNKKDDGGAIMGEKPEADDLRFEDNTP